MTFSPFLPQRWKEFEERSLGKPTAGMTASRAIEKEESHLWETLICGILQMINNHDYWSLATLFSLSTEGFNLKLTCDKLRKKRPKETLSRIRCFGKLPKSRQRIEQSWGPQLEASSRPVALSSRFLINHKNATTKIQFSWCKEHQSHNKHEKYDELICSPNASASGYTVQ